ncbi:hypothetical protein [Mesobacillus selenatarsenatis]|uniref:Uncharacterized protein n=1 Tax=Mesobacillus selenatarsenatis TaxID=388741 RepID=A0A846TKY9_9BACI|nr:hypothetical protein [Mesobacillus selenatarsenatis]NKE06037.1 hypothetical protein [Mesobacillus selenatarsenatis]
MNENWLFLKCCKFIFKKSASPAAGIITYSKVNQDHVVLPLELFKREKADVQPTKDLYAGMKLLTKRVSRELIDTWKVPI